MNPSPPQRSTPAQRTAGRERTPSVALNVLSSWGSTLLNVPILLLLTRFVVQELGPSGYGIWTLVQSFSGFYNLVNLGVVAAITRYVAHHYAAGDHRALNRVASTSMAMFCATALLVGCAALALAGPLSSFFQGVDPARMNEFKHVVWLCGAAVALSFISSVYGGILTAHERILITNAINLGITLVRVALTVLFLLLGQAVIGLALATLVSTIGGLIAFYIACRRLLPHVELRLAHADWGLWKQLVLYGGGAFIITIADSLNSDFDHIIIGRWIGVEAIAVYGVATVIARRLLQVLASGLGPLTPRFAALAAGGRRDEMRQLLLRSQAISAILACGACSVLFVCGERFIVLWVGEAFRPAGFALRILLVSYAIALSQNPSVRLLYAIDRHYQYAAATLIEAALNVAVSIALVGRYGIYGVAAGTACATLLVKLLFQPFYVARMMEMPLWLYGRFLFVVPLLSALVVWGTLRLETHLAPDWSGLLALAASTSAAYTLAMAAALRLLDPELFQVVWSVRWRKLARS